MEAPESNPNFSVISTKELTALRISAEKLRVLEAHGVDNWEWYGEAMRELYGEEDEDE